jgi:hypothetical protein
MELPLRGIIDGLYREARKAAEDGGTERTAGVRDMGHRKVRPEEPEDRGHLMARSDSYSTDNEAEDERIVSIKPMPQWRPHHPGRAPPRRLT